MSIYDFLLTIASQLGDARPGGEFRRYTLRDLTAYFGEAMCFAAAHRPDLFVKHNVMKLQPGKMQDAACCGCTSNLKFHAQVDAEGNNIKDLSDLASSGKDISKWYRAPCKIAQAVDGTGKPVTLITGIEIDSDSAGIFKVSPPVKPGEDIWVKITCTMSPCSPSEADVLAGMPMPDCTWIPALRSYILYRALQGDRHAVGASVEAQNELKNVYLYLKLKWEMEQKIEAA